MSIAKPGHRLVLVLGLCASALAARGARAEAGECGPLGRVSDLELMRRVDAIVDAAVADGFAGGVTLIRDDALVYERVAGSSDRNSRIPVTAETLFHVASISKYFTAVAVLAAVEGERVQLDTTLAELFPGTQLANRGVTVLDLLAHRSGLGSSYAAESETDPAKAVAAIDAQPVDHEKIGSFRYSNDGYDLLAIVLERIYDQPYEKVVRETVLAPACLNRPRFWAEVDLTDAQRVGQPLRSPGRRLRKRNYGMIGSAGLLLTATDLARFEQALASGAVLAEGSLAVLMKPRGELSIGEALLGSFLVEHPRLGRVLSARGYEDWGDNAILNRYLDQGVILAVVTSKGPPENPEPRPFRSRIAREVEEVLSDRAANAEAGTDGRSGGVESR